MTCVAVVGSTDFPLERGAGHLLRLLHDLPKDTLVVVRADAMGQAIMGTDAMVATLARVWDLDVLPVQLDMSVPARERGLERNVRLVRTVDKVIALFTPGREMDGGTGLLCNQAIARGKKVTAYTLADDNSLKEVGDIEPEDAPLPTDFTRLRSMLKTGTLVDGDTLTATLEYDET